MVRRAFTRPAFWAGLALFAAGMAAGAVWDLPLDHALYSPASLPAILMEAFGYYPLYLPAAGLALCAAADQRIAPPWRVLCGAAALAGCAALAAHSFSVLRRRGAPVPMLFTCAVWLVLAVGGALALRYACVSAARLGRLRFACFWGTVYFILELAVIGLLKLVWARTRFDDMLAAGDFSRFTSWLRPFGQGGTSFPSGHTASACGIFALLIVCDVSVRFARRRGLIWAVCWAYVAGMALSRMVMGRHFLSDTVMAAGVMALLFVALTHMGAYRRSLAATLALTRTPRPAVALHNSPTRKQQRRHMGIPMRRLYSFRA